MSLLTTSLYSKWSRRSNIQTQNEPNRSSTPLSPEKNQEVARWRRRKQSRKLPPWKADFATVSNQWQTFPSPPWYLMWSQRSNLQLWRRILQGQGIFWSEQGKNRESPVIALLWVEARRSVRSWNFVVLILERRISHLGWTLEALPRFNSDQPKFILNYFLTPIGTKFSIWQFFLILVIIAKSNSSSKHC